MDMNYEILTSLALALGLCLCLLIGVDRERAARASVPRGPLPASARSPWWRWRAQWRSP